GGGVGGVGWCCGGGFWWGSGRRSRACVPSVGAGPGRGVCVRRVPRFGAGRGGCTRKAGGRGSSRLGVAGFGGCRFVRCVAPRRVRLTGGRRVRWLRWLWWRIWRGRRRDRKSTRLNSSHVKISYAVFCLKKQR